MSRAVLTPFVRDLPDTRNFVNNAVIMLEALSAEMKAKGYSDLHEKMATANDHLKCAYEILLALRPPVLPKATSIGKPIMESKPLR